MPELRAQDYPAKPIRLIVSFPGGSSDVLGRAFAQYAMLGQPVVVENVSGANGAIGLTRLAKSAPDGYTLAIGATPNLAIGPHLNSRLPDDPLKDFTPIGLVARVPIVLVVNGAVPAKSVAELVALARAHPGKLNYGSIGTGSTTHLLGEMLRRSAGIDVVHVPYKGIQQGVTALLAGNVQFILFPVFVDAKAHVRAGALRPLALVDSRRSPVAPDLPTLPELGYPLEAAAWFALIAPAGTPETIVQRLAREMQRVLSLEAMRRFLDDHGMEAGDLGPEVGKAYLASEHARQRERGRDVAPRAGRREHDGRPDARPGRTGHYRLAAGHHRPALAPRLRRRVRRFAGGIRTDAEAAAREAPPHRHGVAGHRGRVRERFRQRAALQRALQAALPAQARSIARPAAGRRTGSRRRRRRSGGGRLLSPQGTHPDRRQGAHRLDRGRDVAQKAHAARRGLRIARQGAAAGALARQGADGSRMPSRRGSAGAGPAGKTASGLARARRVRWFRNGRARDPRPAGDGGGGAYRFGPLRRDVRRFERNPVRFAHDIVSDCEACCSPVAWNHRAPRHARRARSHRRRARARGGGRTPRSRTECRHRGDARRAARAAGRRGMDRAIHRDAGAVLARRISAHGSGRDESARRDRCAPSSGRGRSLAALARVRRDASVAITDKGVNHALLRSL